MTPEEMNRAIEFLIQHSAQFSVQMEQLRTHHEQFSGHMEQLRLRQEQFSGHMDQLRLRQEQFSGHMEQFQLRQEEFAARQDRDHEMLIRGLADLRESTGRFQVWATELLAIQSKRLDRHDRILDRLPPVQGPEGTPGH